jgi:hypothetical protein
MKISSRSAVPTLLAASIAVLVAAPGHACSVCRCGDPTFNSLGTDLFTAGRFQFAFDADRIEKEQGSATDAGGTDTLEEGGLERLVEERWTLTASYAFNDRYQGVARVPWSHRELTEGDESTTASGRGDPEIYGLVRLWSAPWSADVGRRGWISLLAGVKTNWGENDLGGAQRFDEHVQAGTGSSDPFAGLSAVRLIDPHSSLYGSFQLRFPGRNSAGYRYGDVTLANIGYEHKLGDRFDASLEANFRRAQEDEVDRAGERDPDTGGSILYLSPRLLVALGDTVAAHFTVQVPVNDNLNGEQDEKIVFNFGVTASF